MSTGNQEAPRPAREPHVVDVFLTFDTELSPGLHGIQRVSPEENYRRSIEGISKQGAFGLPYILRTLDEHGLRGVFFVEALCAAVLGDDVLRRTLDPILQAGHDAELHVHTEWLRFEFTPWRPYEEFWNIHQFDVERQHAILERALEHFRSCTGKTPVAFRAGNYGANADTLRALSRVGLSFDSSHNLSYMDTTCRMEALGELAHARRFDGVWEVPVTVFYERPGKLRHAQIGASSFLELRGALDFAWRSGLSTVVIVGHSFELLKANQDAVMPLVVRRFRNLCRFLAENRDRFHVIGFDETDPTRWSSAPDAFHRSSLALTMLRMAEQASLRLTG